MDGSVPGVRAPNVHFTKFCLVNPGITNECASGINSLAVTFEHSGQLCKTALTLQAKISPKFSSPYIIFSPICTHRLRV
jgi:hypothetical protein